LKRNREQQPLADPQSSTADQHLPVDRFPIDRVRDRIRRHSYQPIAADDGVLGAAVLVPLYQLGGELHIVLTKRTTLMSMQKGHISFPGGRREPADRDLQTTALRESHEEIGLDPLHVEIFGRIDDFSTRDGAIFIAGFVGLIDPAASPYPWRPAQREVAEILEVPVRHLLDPVNVIVNEPRELNGRLWPDEIFLFREHRVFGATARALRHVLNIAFAEGGADK
jgi:8-oxo-dGTP pyrophosphatase MutT (NUDIX family)